ncbi:Ig-like domain-containing protein [Gayadomonas joobiniege]|uniref:Ig-like domain-containing protein n=1 Tax=Gayadomonas joobiniege TaxID=1234606 RepID=UPI00036C4306|nr:Ig-like domain-containing protein [Gayadomonas joobiniege]
MKIKLLSSVVLTTLLAACGGSDDDNTIAQKAVIPADENGDTTLYLSYIEEDPKALVNLLDGVETHGRQAFVVNPRCQVDPETGEPVMDPNNPEKELLIPEQGVIMRANIMEIDPSKWNNQVKYTVDGPEEIVYNCYYSIDNFAREEVQVEVEGEDGEMETVTEIQPVMAERRIQLTIRAKEHLAETLEVSHDADIEVPLNHSGFNFAVFEVLPENASIKTVEYSSNNSDVLEIDSETGAVTINGLGTAEVTIQTESPNNPVTVTRTVHVVEDTSKPIGAAFYNEQGEVLTKLDLEEKTSIKINAKALFMDGVDPANSNTKITFRSLNEEMATVDEEGNITAGVKLGQVRIAAITEEQGFFGFITLNVTGDPSLFKLNNSDFESGVFGEVGTWQEFGAITWAGPISYMEGTYINSDSPIDGNYDAYTKTPEEGVLKWQAGGFELKFIDPEEGEEIDPSNPLNPPILKSGVYTLSLDTKFTTNRANNNFYIQLWHMGQFSKTAPESLSDPYYNQVETTKVTKWGLLKNNTQSISVDLEFDLEAPHKLYKIALSANHGETGNIFTWYVDNIRLVYKGPLPKP